MPTIAVLDYGMGNLRSVAKALELVAKQATSSCNVLITDNAASVANADRLVFPGQGAMSDCMRELEAKGLRSVVMQAATSKPFLGICVGLQMLFEQSEEGSGGTPGLNLLPGRVKRFPKTLAEHGLKVPHMGWNHLQQETNHPLWQGIENFTRFYFVHSYYVIPQHASDTCGSTTYAERFTSAVAHGNIFAVQFHPEKSGLDGLRLLANFLNWKP